ncbi:MAG: NTP transferase domain-containing protein [Spirochaetes bacterium]|nr:NTP transferase domain-containing protein [Spirochaetota bacterium]
MKAFLLAAGYGERLRPITRYMPKPLVPVCNVPCLCYSVALIREAGIREAVCNLHYRPDDIERFIGGRDNFGLDLRYSREETILGTGGGLKRCEALFRDEPLLLVNGDIVSDVDTAALLRDFEDSGMAAMAVIREMPEGTTGTVALDGDRIVDFRGTLGSGLAHRYDYTGVAVLSPEAFRYLSREPTSVVYTAFTSLASRGRLAHRVHRGFWRDIGSVAQYLEANLAVMEQLPLRERVERWTGMTTEPVSRDARIDPGAQVQRSVIGGGCRVGSGARIRESLLMPGNAIGEGEEIIRSVFTEQGERIQIGSDGDAIFSGKTPAP